MNILIISGIYDQKPKSGGALLMKLYAEELERQGHHVVLLYETSSDSDPVEATKHLANAHYLPDWKNDYYATQSVLSKIKNKISVFRSDKEDGYFSRDFTYLKSRLADCCITHAIDIIEVHFPWMMPVQKVLPKEIPSVFVSHELQYLKFGRNKADVAAKNVVTELGLASTYNAVCTLTPVEYQVLKRDLPKTRVANLPLGVVQQSDVLPVAKQADKFLFIGGSGHAPNREALEFLLNEIWPIARELSDLHLHLIGKHDEAFIAGFEKDDRCHWHGFVDDLSEMMHGGISLVPVLTGSGIRVKILESMAKGAPVVATTMAAEGIAVKHNEDILLQNNAADFAKAMETLANQPDKYYNIATQAQQTVYNEYLLSKTVTDRVQYFQLLLAK